MIKLRAITELAHIPEEYRGTPIEDFLKYQNFNAPFTQTYASAQILIGMCMDNRKMIRVPENFAYILRTGGANLRHSEFKVSYAIAVGGIKNIALIGHTNCGMRGLMAKKEAFIQGLVEQAGWSRELAEEHFQNYAPMFEIGDEVDFITSETQRLRRRYPKILVAPLIYKLEDGLLYFIEKTE